MLFFVLNDAEKKDIAVKALERLWENTKKRGDCEF